MVSMSKIMISDVFMSLIVGAFMIFYSEAVEEYSVVDYTSENLQVFKDQMNDMSSIANETKTSIEQLTQPSSAFDVIGGFFNTGFNVLKTAGQSFDSLFTITYTGVNSLPFTGDYGNLFIAAMSTMLLIIIFLGIFLGIVLKSDKT